MTLQNETIKLRALEPEDINTLFDLENDELWWKYANRVQPYSKDLLKEYLAQAHKDIFETRQLRFTMVNAQDQAVGFVDLFDFEPLHHRAGVGLIVSKENQRKGYGSAALELLSDYAKTHLQLHQLYVHIAEENQISIRLFEKHGFVFAGSKKDWNFYEGAYHNESIYQKLI